MVPCAAEDRDHHPVPGPCEVGSLMQRHVVRLAEARERVGGVTGLATRALVVTALVGGTGAYLHAGTSTNGDAAHDGAQRFAAAGLHEAASSDGAQTLSSVQTLGTALATDPEPASADVGTTKDLRPMMLVNVFHDGCTTPVVTTARTVRGALAEGKVACRASRSGPAGSLGDSSHRDGHPCRTGAFPCGALKSQGPLRRHPQARRTHDARTVQGRQVWTHVASRA